MLELNCGAATDASWRAVGKCMTIQCHLEQQDQCRQTSSILSAQMHTHSAKPGIGCRHRRTHTRKPCQRRKTLRQSAQLRHWSCNNSVFFNGSDGVSESKACRGHLQLCDEEKPRARTPISPFPRRFPPVEQPFCSCPIAPTAV